MGLAGNLLKLGHEHREWAQEGMAATSDSD